MRQSAGTRACCRSGEQEHVSAEVTFEMKADDERSQPCKDRREGGESKAVGTRGGTRVLANLEDAGLIATPPPLAAWPGAFPSPLHPPTPPHTHPLPCGPLLVQLSPCHPRHSSWGQPRGGSPFHLVSIHSLWQTGEGQ